MRRFVVIVLGLTHALLLGQEVRNFESDGVLKPFADRSSEFPTYLRNLRTNRAGGGWQVDLVVSNASAALPGAPWLVFIDRTSNLAGVVGGVAAEGGFTLDAPARAAGAGPAPGSTVGPVTVRLDVPRGAPSLRARVFALLPDSPVAPQIAGRTLDEAGQPLEGASMVEIGPADAVSIPVGRAGWFSGTAREGVLGWRFSKPGHLDAFRPVAFSTFPFADAVVLPVAGPLPAVIGMHALPAPLPSGWSPAAVTRFAAGAVEFSPGIEMSAGAALVRWDEASLRWMTVSRVTGEALFQTNLPSATTLAYVVPDTGAIAPPATIVGDPLAAGPGFLRAEGVVAEGAVVPASRPATTNATQVTVEGEVVFRSTNGPIASGTAFRCEIREEYSLRDGSRRVLPAYSTLIRGYRGPADDVATVHARFPLRPVQLLGADTLREAVVRVEVLAAADETLVSFPAPGGAITNGAIRVVVPAGGATSGHLRLREADVATLSGVVAGGLPVLAAFELDAPTLGEPFQIALPSQSPGGKFVLARAIFDRAAFGLQPVLRFASDDSGALVSSEPVSGGLRGVDGGGLYLLLDVGVSTSPLRGVARDASGNVSAGLVVRSGPWTAFTDGAGRYELLSPAGTAGVTAFDAATGDTADGSVPVDTSGRPVELNLDLSPRGPVVVSVSPTNAAVNVSAVTPVSVAFSRPLNPATVVADGAVRLLDTNGIALAASVSANLAGDLVTLLPVNPLPASSRLVLQLAASLRDRTGRPLEGEREFFFNTAARSLRRPDAIFTIYEPVDGLAGMSGGPGLAEPGQAVILVNETTGVTATVLAAPDGSFTNSITAGVDDELVVVLQNDNGTRNRITPSSQIFADGSVGIFDGGGTVTQDGPDGPVSLTLGRGASHGRTVVKLTPLEVSPATNGVPPPPFFNGVAATLDVQMSGDEADGYAGLSVPFDAAKFGVPAGVSPTNMTFALAIMRVVDGVPTYQIVDQLRFADGRLATDPANGFSGWLEGLRADTNALYSPPDSAGAGTGSVAKISAGQGRAKILGTILFALETFRMAVFAAMDPPYRVEGKVGLCPAQIEGQCMDALADPFFVAADAVFGNLPGAGNLSVALQAFSEFNVLGEIRNAARFPLPGAIVDAARIVGPAPTPESRFDRASSYAITDRNGRYTMLLPSARDVYLMRARHPAYRDRDFGPMNPILESGLVAIARRDFTLLPDTGINLPPGVQITTSPIFPATNEPVELRIDVIHPRAQFASVSVALDLVRPVAEDAGPGPGFTNIVRGPAVRDTANSTPSRARFVATVSANRTLSARFRITGSVEAPEGASTGPLVTTEFASLVFGPGRPTNVVAASDPLDRAGPSLVRTEPVAGGLLSPGDPIRLYFNEPIAGGITNDIDSFTVSPSLTGSLAVRLSDGHTVVEIFPPFLTPDTEYRIDYTAPVTDVSGNGLQNGSLSGSGIRLRFRTPQVRSATLAGIDQGGGAVAHGAHLFALDRAGNGRLVVFDVSNPTRPSPVAEAALPGFPRDLEIIPAWSYYIRDPQKGGTARTNRTLLAIVGGSAGTSEASIGRIDFQRQYLRIYDVTEPARPERIASAEVTVGPSVVQKVSWHPPHLAFFDNGADLQRISVVDLQGFIIAYNTPVPDRASFPLEFRPGVDGSGLNPDGTTNTVPNGHYTDVGDKVPKPDRAPLIFHAQVAGFGGDLLDGSRRILDYDYDQHIGLGVIVFSGGVLGSGGEQTPRPPGVRIAYLGGTPIGTQGQLLYQENARPKRVSLLMAVNVASDGPPDFRNLAFVSLAPDSDGKPKLSVVDISDPFRLRELVRADLPGELGLPQSAYRLPDGRLALGMTSDALIIEPSFVLRSARDQGLHPMFRGVLPRAGSGNQTLAVSDAGVLALVLGARNELVQFPPSMRFVRFADNTTLTNNTATARFAGANVLRAQDLRADPLKLFGLLDALQTMTSIGPAPVVARNSNNPSLLPATRSAHQYVLLQAPGGAGPEVMLGLQSLNRAGLPMKNKGRDFPAVRAVSEQAKRGILQSERAGCDAPVHEFKAFRLSDDPKSEFFNLYLSEPFALTGDRIDLQREKDIQAVLTRPVLWSGFALSAFIDPLMQGNAVLGPYAARIAGSDSASESGDIRIVPRVEALAETWPATYLPGDRPPPVNGHQAVPGTFGMVNADNGEIRHETVDISLPGRGKPIVFERFFGGQDLYEGPFGHGWDFGYNQQVVPLRPQTFGSRTELVLAVRRITNSVGQVEPFARSGDLLFSDGQGHLVSYVNTGGANPPEVATDPLVSLLRWRDQARTCYLPSTNFPGVFDPIFEFADGTFARLNPDGEQFWYDRFGRLSKIYGAFPENNQELVYNERSDLTRVIDHAVPGSVRQLEIGYYRLPADQLFVDGLDVRTNSVFVAGKIARLKDYAGRMIDYVYDGDGLLKYRIGIGGNGANNGSNQRPVTEYLQGGCGIVGGITAGGEPSQMDSALFAVGVNPGTQTAAANGNGVGGPVTMQFSTNAVSSSRVTGPDGAVTEMKFDARGYPAVRIESGPGTGTATNSFAFNRDGLLTNSVGPLGDRMEYVYDTANPVLRARGNLLLERHVPGSRGGDVIERSMPAYDLRYNQPVGATRDFNGFTHEIELTSDGREIRAIRHQDAGATIRSFNEYGQMLTEDGPDGVHIGFRYGGSSGFVEGRFVGANETVLSYDGSTASKLGAPTRVRPPAGAEINVTYDDRLLPTSVTRGQSERKMGYNANGRIVYLETKAGAIARLIKTFEYNRINFLEKITVKSVDVNGADADIVTRFISSPQDAWRVRRIVYDTGGQTRLLDYDHLGHLRRNALGSYVEETAYDLNGNPVEFKQGGVVTRTMTYDGHDRLLDLVQRATDSRSETTTHRYHPGGEIKSVVVRDDTFGESYDLLIETIDALGRPKSRRVKGSSADGLTQMSYPASSAGGSVVADGPRDRVESSHDNAGYPVGALNGVQSATFVPDGNGNITRVRTSGDGRTYSADFGFNVLDQLDRVDDDLGLVADPEPRVDGAVERTTDGRGKTVTRDFSVLGEIRQATRANGVQFNWRRDANRQLKLSGDATLKGHQIDYDAATLRMTAFRLRSGEAFSFSSPNHLNLPESVAIPGGQMSLGYDDAGRVVSRDVSYGPGLPYKMTTEHDALGRPRDMTYGTDGRYSASYKYDLLGPLTEASYTESHGTFTVLSTPYSDGTRQTLGYPSGLSLVEERDSSGRILVVRRQGGGDLYRVTKYVGAGERGEVTLGDGLIREVSRFDMRRRNTARRYVRGADGGVLADVRYRYDAAGNIVARQEVHRHGRAEVYAYDDGDRLSRADFELRPPVQELVRTSSTGLQAAFGLDAGSHARKYGYDGFGLDLLQTIETVSPNLLAISPTPFVQSLSDADAMLFPTRLDGVSRAGPDPLGNTIDTRLLVTSPGGFAGRMPATLKYTGLSQLGEIVRDDGVTLSYEHRPDGLVHRRRVAGGGRDSDTALVWHEGRLLEEYERVGGTNQLRARYLYADEDSPFGADFRDPVSGELTRYWYLRDALGSVVALVDADGVVVERYRYDPWGRPVIEGRDGRPPRVAFVTQSSGSLLVQFSEPVLPAYSPAAPAELPGADGSLAVDSMRFPQDFIRVQTTTGLDRARLVLEEDLPGGFPYGTVVRVVLQGAGTIVGLSITGDAVTDEWGNGNISEIITFASAGAGQPVYQALGALQDSRPPQLAQSAIGSPMLFHGQYWDADAGLLYLRARFYDPGTGMFLQQDPMGYQDSPNLYAFGGNNPVSFRDPSGKARGRSKRVRVNDTVPDGAPVADSSLPTVADGGSGGIAARKQPRSSQKADAISSVPQPKPAPKGPETKQQLRERVMENLKISAGARNKSAYREPPSRMSSELPYEIYYTPQGEKRIRFRASAAKTAKEANPGRNYSPDAEAGINIEGDVYVFEGRHRAAGAARGDFVPEELGGVPGRRGWLDYAYRSSTPDDIGLEVKNLKLDYKKKEASTAAEAELLWDLENNGPLVIP